MNPADDISDDHFIAGAHGTIAPQQDEAYYDDRSDASDDMEKGRLKFPEHIYGREKELTKLLSTYGEIVKKSGSGAAASAEEDIDDSIKSNDSNGSDIDLAQDNIPEDDAPYSGSRVVWLGGYSGIGKTALVGEFIKQAGSKYAVDQSLSIVHASGKYSEQCTSSAPFSAVAEVLDKLAMSLSDDSVQNKSVWEGIGKSELIGPGKEGGQILRSTFPSLKQLLDKSNSVSGKGEGGNTAQGVSTHASNSMSAIKACTYELLCCICEALVYPLGIFVDDLQWGDAASFDIIQFLLSSKTLNNIMFICSFRSNEVDADHPFAKTVEAVTDQRDGTNSVEKMDLFSLSPDAIANFVADSVKKEMSDEVAELAEVVYTKTMGNIFFVMQALEELARKNIIFYDMMYFEWRWVASKLDLARDVSDDVVESVKGKIRELPDTIQHLLIVMAHIPNPLDATLLRALMNTGEYSFGEAEIKDLLKMASDEGLVLRSVGSRLYIFAHDRIRQASLEYGKERDGDQYALILHVSQVMRDFAQGPETEWCLFVAVDLLNSLPPDRTINLSELAKLNLKVSKLASGRGSSEKALELLHQSLKYLKSSGMLWKDYALTLEIFNAIISSEFNLGSYDKTRSAIDEVIANATSMDDKLVAYLHRLLVWNAETSDYKQGVLEGVRILNLYGFNIPQTFSKTYMLKEEAKHKLSLKSCPYSQMKNLPMNDGKIFLLCFHTLKYAIFAGHSELLKILPWKAIHLARKKGMDRHFPLFLSTVSASLVGAGKIKTSQEVGNVALTLAELIRDDRDDYSTIQMGVWCCVLAQVQPFSDSCGPLLQAYKDLKLVGSNAEMCLNSMMGYFLAYFASGMELGPLLESKLRLVAEYARSLNSMGYLTIFQIFLQFALNLRTASDKPTEFQGAAFNEMVELSDMTESARKQALRDSSTYRLQLSFIFNDEATMTSMLEILKDYPISDVMVGRGHNRHSFIGLAPFLLGQNGNTSFLELGDKCLSYFENLTKHGSVNAKPVYLFMLALKRPGREPFKKAIDACNEASFLHLEAMARECYASFLFKLKDVKLGNDYLISAYWLYREWGADYKALRMSQEHEFLVKSSRETAKSTTGTYVSESVHAPSRQDSVESSGKYTFSFNSTLKSKKKIKNKSKTKA